MGIPSVLSIEPGEAIFSLAVRYCRWNEIELSRLLSGSCISDRTGFRDFPIAVSRIESAFNVDFIDRDHLLTSHSAAAYYAVTLPEPFRSEVLNRSTKAVGDLLRISIGSRWSHLRFCRSCATSEFNQFHYSWWHRDHQLPLESICMVHGCPLDQLRIDQLELSLPHDLLRKVDRRKRNQMPATEVAKTLSRIEICVAKGEGRGMLKQRFEEISSRLQEVSSDYIEQAEIVSAAMKRVILALRDQGVNEPFDDWERILVELKRLLHSGFDYADPVVTILLVTSLSTSLCSPDLGFLARSLSDALSSKS